MKWYELTEFYGVILLDKSNEIASFAIFIIFWPNMLGMGPRDSNVRNIKLKSLRIISL
jgi:hypothetical protein